LESILKKSKKILVTEEDLRKILEKNIVFEKRFYTWSQPYGSRFSRSVSSPSCLAAKSGAGRLDSEKARLKNFIKAGIESEGYSVGADGNRDGGPRSLPMIEQIPDEKIIWEGPTEHDMGELAGGDYIQYRLTIGVEAISHRGRNYERRAIVIRNNVLQSGTRPVETSAESSTDEIKRLLTQKISIREANGLSAGDQPAVYLNSNDEGDLNSAHEGRWFYNLAPEAVQWLRDWVQLEKLCPEEDRETVVDYEDRQGTSRSSSSRGGGDGISGAGALVSTSWWRGNRATGRPVSSSTSGQSVLVVARLSPAIISKLFEHHPNIRDYRVRGGSLESGRVAFLLPATTRARDAFDDTSLSDAQSGLSANRGLVGSYDTAMEEFRGHEPAKRLINSITYAAAEAGARRGSAAIDLTG